ncbi:MAG: HlyD family type I secretion periplasmic adaptor subunit [Mesorhizobium sp.]|uniref:HlyD family type I secretion periplasmic adaptor subunit n=1 Tax=Mesorhizobium sp. TaxID=1871066 RepID=UPI00121F2D59|nr:HlyD family type I secretion periplasmic adaptor subunit [Mesorhizobium sp.]TIM26424.1 MAG: HlyD family type I secretion periplasmic adaptor subunit [Mesorhizobium sp.]
MQRHRTIAIAEVTPRLRTAIAIGLAAILLFFGAFGGWAAFAPLKSAVLADGIVKVDGERKVVQHLEGGIVDRLFVREGDLVEAGDVVIGLDDTQSRARLNLLNGRLVNRLALSSRLRAERDGADTVSFPASLTRSPSVSTGDALRVQTQVFEARRLSIEGQTAILTKRIEQTLEEITGIEQLVEAQDRLIAMLAQEVGDLEALFEKGLTTRERYMVLRRRQAELEGERSIQVASIARARKAVSELEQQIADISTTRLNQAVDQLSQVEEELLELQQQIRSAEDILGRVDIRAPVSGTVMNLQVHSARGVIAPGQPLMDIVPMPARLVVEAHVRPEDVEEIAPGQAVQIRFLSYRMRRLPLVTGSVRLVSADRLVDERSGQAYFATMVDVDVGPLAGADAAPIVPGMPADVVIVTGSRTLLEYLGDPLVRVLHRTMRER